MRSWPRYSPGPTSTDDTSRGCSAYSTWVVGRLDDRAEEGDVVVRLALDYLAARYPDVVESTLDGEPTDPPKPTDVADVPPAVDDVVGKAMATEKLRRYETATQLRQQLRRLVPEGGDGE